MRAHSVSILGREEGYMVKYGLSTKEIARAGPYFTVYPNLSPNKDLLSATDSVLHQNLSKF